MKHFFIGINRNPKNIGNYQYQRIYAAVGETPSLSTTEDQSTTSSQIRRREVKLVVVAPPGSLGVVIGAPKGDSIPSVHAIKDTSALINDVQIGDRLISVDGEDTTKLSAIRVSNLIGSKAKSPQRVLVFARDLSRI